MIKKILLFLVVQSCFFSQFVFADEASVLYLKVFSVNENIVVKANLMGEHLTYKVKESKTKINLDFSHLWNELDTWEVTKESVDKRISHYEDLFLKPINGLLKKAKQIHFIVDENSVRYAMGLIPYEGKPLFLHYPISYSYNNVVVTQKSFYSESWSGLSISDHTADPENAASYLSKFILNNSHYKMEDLSYSKFVESGPFDVLLFSLHGVRTDSSARMTFNEQWLSANDFSHFKSKLIYLDSCQMGSSIDFLKKLQDYGNEFFIAPLFSNEAGGSSSATIKGFFSNLKSGDSPAVSMYKVRKELFEKYSKSDGVDVAYWKAFPFRVYQQI
ncbi:MULTISPECIES: hypothetical protein [Pseudoalteromonas]|uniref:CHAT domain-containing protein n=1 Tax=Pseudoalteromonas byunsanensis TaxID=327939 RepID=A0A1S1N1V2_9GAMM|nr:MULTISPECIES: hypothetical protein [Pseudoalteromonas]OHU93434.1 hypothetical protein BIW53_18915 [Pseudoalteromonas byunsanensis]